MFKQAFIVKQPASEASGSVFSTSGGPQSPGREVGQALADPTLRVDQSCLLLLLLLDLLLLSLLPHQKLPGVEVAVVGGGTKSTMQRRRNIRD